MGVENILTCSYYVYLIGYRSSTSSYFNYSFFRRERLFFMIPIFQLLISKVDEYFSGYSFFSPRETLVSFSA